MGLLSFLDSLINFKIVKENTEIFDNSKMLDEIARDLGCIYSKEIDPTTFSSKHCLYQCINGTNYKVAEISEDFFDLMQANTNLYDEIVSTLKYEKDFNIEKIKRNARIDCTMKY